MQMPKLRFMADDGNDFPEWEENSLSLFLKENKLRNADLRFGKDDVLSVSGDYGVVNQIEFQGRSFVGKSVQQYRILPHNGIVYTKSPLKANPYGIIKANKGEDGIVSTLYAVFDCKDNIIAEFIELYFDLDERLNKYLKPLVNIGAKHDMKISNERFLSGSVCFPSLPEQRKIATFLSTVDEIIATTEAEVSAWEERKKGVMQKLFSQEVRFKADDGSDYPEWEEKKLGELFTRIVEKNRMDLSPLTIIQGKGTVRRADSDRRITYDRKGLKNYKAVKKNDFIVHLRSFEGGLEIANQDGIVSPAYHVYRGNADVYPRFYYPYFRSNNFIHGRLAICVTGVRDGKNIEMDTFDELLLPCPCIEEQQKIANCLSSFDDVINQTKTELAAWQEFKKGLLQQMFV